MHPLKSTANTGILASLDVESLFTNVPVIETIEIIINRGPLFANFYMAELENNIIPFLKPEESPLVYYRYVDDIFLIVNRKSTINLLKTKFEEASVLQFTYEIEKHHELTFLDVNITHKNNQIESRKTESRKTETNVHQQQLSYQTN